MNINLPMAVVDVIPVVLFLIVNIKMLKCCYNKMSKAQYAMYSGGALLLFTGAICKIVWKFLYALKICDYTTLSECFFPMQAFGFILLCIAMTGMLKSSKSKNTEKLMAAVPVTSTHMPFLLVTLLSMTYFYGTMVALAKKINKKGIFLLILSYLGMIANCFVGQQANNATENVALLHWIAEITHIWAEVFLLMTVIKLEKSGFADKDSLSK